MRGFNPVMKLDKIDKRILYELGKNCRITNTQLGKIVGRSREAVAYRIEQLQKKGIIEGFITFLNPSRFGKTLFKFYVQLNNYPEERKKFIEELKAMPDLWWTGIGDGVWDVHGTMFAESVIEFYKIKNHLLSKYKNLIIRAEFGTLVKVYSHPTRIFLDKKEKVPMDYKMFAGEVIPNKLDKVDKKMINVLLHNGRIPLSKLAQKVDSTIDIVRNKLKRMYEKEIIIQNRLALNWTKLGLEYFKAFVYFKKYSEKEVKKFVEYASQNRNVIFIILQLSTWDMELEIVVKNYPEFNAIMNDFREKFPELIKSYESVLMVEDCFMTGMKV